MFLEWENNRGKFQNNAINDVKQISLSHVIIITIIITKSHNNYWKVGVMELCLLNFLILIHWFLRNSYHCVLFESFSHVINQKSHIYLWNLGKSYLAHFWNFGIFKISKSELGKFIPNFPLKNVITSSNSLINADLYKQLVLKPVSTITLLWLQSINCQFNCVSFALKTEVSNQAEAENCSGDKVESVT